MRITKESMLRLARDTAAIRANEDHSIVCIYVTGSVVTEDPFIGGTTDIDLFIVHAGQPVVSREVRCHIRYRPH
jgi:predicted nucleotidyltransferase